MATFDRLLVGPLRFDLCEVLTQAAGVANTERKLLPEEPDYWGSVVDELGSQPEGVREWCVARSVRAGFVRVAWWTDHRGKRHFRVHGAAMTPEALEGLHLSPTWAIPTSPFHYIYHDHAFFRAFPADEDRLEQGAWRAVCACGAVGEPREIGWT